MKSFIIFLGIFLVLFAIICMPVSAHVLAMDGTMGAILHIDPNDEPIAGQQSNFFLEFKDTANKFHSNNCACRVDVIENGKTIYSDALFKTDGNKDTDIAFDSITFPQEDVYQIYVIGQPKNSNTFTPFKLVYNVRVDQKSDNTSQQDTANKLLIYEIMGGVLIFVVSMTIVWKIIKKDTALDSRASQNDTGR